MTDNKKQHTMNSGKITEKYIYVHE